MTEPSASASTRELGDAPRRRRWPPPQTHENRRRVLDTVTFERSGRRVWRYTVLMVLSIVIAVMGLTLDSAAVVIGAMLIAPLMTPVMGVAAALSMGWPRHAVRAGLVVVPTAAAGVGVAYAVAALTPDAGITHEILTRTAPDLRDLVVAVAAGAAGAYALTREDVSAALPGVAVAVALVPPLATVGVVLHLGRTDLVEGAALLFVTNLVAIALVGMMVFLLTGFVPLSRLARVRRRVLASTVAVVVATIAASVPLAVRTQSIAHRTADLRRLNTVITDWLTPVPSLEVVDVRIDGQAVLIRLEGPDAPPDVASLDASVQQTLGAGHNLDVQWTQRNHAVAGDRSTDQLPTVAELQPLIEAWLATSSTPASIQSVERDKKRLVVEVNGTLPPPPAGVLADELQSRLGFPVDVVVRWNRTAALDTKSLAEAAVRSWLIARPDVTLLDVEVRATGVTVTLAGPQAPPDVADLTDLIHTALGSSVDLSVQLVPVTVLPTTTVPG